MQSIYMHIILYSYLYVYIYIYNYNNSPLFSSQFAATFTNFGSTRIPQYTVFLRQWKGDVDLLNEPFNEATTLTHIAGRFCKKSNSMD